MSQIMIKKYIPTGVIVIVSTIITLEFFSENATLGAIVDQFSTWAAILIAFSLSVAFLTTVINKVRIVTSMKQGEWYYSVAFLVILGIQVYLGLTAGFNNFIYKNIYNNVAITAYQAMSATTALFIISAAFKAFRIRTTESTLLMIIAVITLIGQTTLGAAISPIFPSIRTWIWDYPAGGVMRGITIVTAIGLVSITLRVMSGITNVLGETISEEG